MTLQERFDNIIDCIERLVHDGEYDVPQALSKETGLNLRLIGDAFQFVTDMTLIKYIRQRRLVYALLKRFEFNLPIEQIASDAGFSDAAAFSKACKNEFALSPSQITEEALEGYPPLSFARVTSGRDGNQPEDDALIITTKKDSICGISAEQFAEIKQVLEIGAIYGLDDEEAEFVYRLALHCKTSTAKAAEFYEDYNLQIENGSYLAGQNFFDLAELSCMYDLSFSESQSILYEIGCHGYESIHDLPDGFFDIYFCKENDRHGWDVEYICDIAEAMKANGLTFSQFNDVIFQADMNGTDLVDAAENLQEYEDRWNRQVFKVLDSGILEDDMDGFGYRNIWEVDE